ncbi:OB-fold-containig protein [Micromonospora coerulea]|uniref:OB-fold-containig protein n=1 Tax=Micromonospora coerulea TaxID=47856 RepID=UPI0019038510|nr:OB-fold-containig protein [Micromonospora veneta]
MGGFFATALSFPTVLFSFLLLVVVGYWLLVLTGVLDLGDDLDADGVPGGVLAGLGLGNVPSTVAFSLLVAVAWFVCLAGTALLDGLGLGAVARIAVLVGVLLAAVLCAWAVTRLVAVPLSRLFPTGTESSRHAFVGSLCTIRTGQVTADFGQAEVTAPDGSSAIVQVRQPGAEPLCAGSSALIYDYDVEGEFFWVMPAGIAFQPDPSRPAPM